MIGKTLQRARKKNVISYREWIGKCTTTHFYEIENIYTTENYSFFSSPKYDFCVRTIKKYAASINCVYSSQCHLHILIRIHKFSELCFDFLLRSPYLAYNFQQLCTRRLFLFLPFFRSLKMYSLNGQTYTHITLWNDLMNIYEISVIFSKRFYSSAFLPWFNLFWLLLSLYHLQWNKRVDPSEVCAFDGIQQWNNIIVLNLPNSCNEQW